MSEAFHFDRAHGRRQSVSRRPFKVKHGQHWAPCDQHAVELAGIERASEDVMLAARRRRGPTGSNVAAGSRPFGPAFPGRLRASR